MVNLAIEKIEKKLATRFGIKFGEDDPEETVASYLKNDSVDYIAGIESRGFIFGAPLAQMLRVGFVPIRKKGKLPCEVHQVEYELEYGTDVLEIDRDFDASSKKIVLIDDLLATGGTVVAAAKLIRMCKGEVLKALFVVDLTIPAVSHWLGIDQTTFADVQTHRLPWQQ